MPARGHAPLRLRRAGSAREPRRTSLRALIALRDPARARAARRGRAAARHAARALTRSRWRASSPAAGGLRWRSSGRASMCLPACRRQRAGTPPSSLRGALAASRSQAARRERDDHDQHRRRLDRAGLRSTASRSPRWRRPTSTTASRCCRAASVGRCAPSTHSRGGSTTSATGSSPADQKLRLLDATSAPRLAELPHGAERPDPVAVALADAHATLRGCRSMRSRT